MMSAERGVGEDEKPRDIDVERRVGVSGIRLPARTVLGRRRGTAQNDVSSLEVLLGGGGQEDGSWRAWLMSSAES